MQRGRPKGLKNNMSMREKFKSVIGNPMITKSIDGKAFTILRNHRYRKIKNGIYEIFPVGKNSKKYLVVFNIMNKNKNKYEIICSCQGNGEFEHCSHALAIMILKYIEGIIPLFILEDYCKKARESRKPKES